RGDGRRAAHFLAEAGYSAYYYENWDALTESIWLGWINHMASGGAGVYAPLEPVAEWTQLNRMQHVATKLRLAQAESLLWMGQVEPAAAAVDAAARRMGEMRGGLTNIHLLYLQANVNLMRRQFTPAGELLNQAVAAQASASLRNFQIGRTNEMFDASAISPRIAADLYASLLADPRPADWAYQPLDTMAVLKTAHDPAFDRWFLAAVDRKEFPLALEVAERTKRRRFLASLPLGGRLLALRTILEAPDTSLSRNALLERQQFLVSFPAYRELMEAGAAMQEALRTGSVVPQSPEEIKLLSAQYDAWAANTRERQEFLMQLAPRRLPSSLEFPPLRTVAELQQSLAKGEALVEFHAVGGELHGFLVTRTGVHSWQIDDLRRLRSGISEFLRAQGNYSATRTFSAEELSSERWQKTATDAYKAIFGDSRLDLARTTSLVIVPDDVLWYLPFDALIAADLDPQTPLADHVPVRYGPTGALSLRRPEALRRAQHTGVVANHVDFGKDDAETKEMVEQLYNLLPGAVRLPDPLPEPPHLVAALLDGLVVLDDVDSQRMTGNSPLPLPRYRGASDDANAWAALPYGGPERIVITGLATAAEEGLKGSRRGAARDVRPGGEIFQTLCRMMAGGARTILLTRWRTGGRTNLELVREFTQELSQAPAAEAWGRARLLAREAPLDAENEPRLRGLEQEGELATANHPFFWAGYLLVDTGPPALAGEEDAEAAPASDAPTATKAVPLPPPVEPEGEVAANDAGDEQPAESSTSQTPN
ncbi:MAG TPA: CHAT domain-containing protein, partial [Lacipirellulaceae bacterium]|nr:CHAT domain-containing protein [Lacipirellulaceae bacterium]